MKSAVLLALVSVTTAQLDPSAVNQAQTKLYTIEDALWRNVTNQNWSDTVPLGADIEIARIFTQVDRDLQDIQRPLRPPVRSWVWTKTVEKLQIIESIYKTFADFMRKQTLIGAVPSPIKEWLDLTEAVLTDPKSSAALTLRSLDDLLEHGDIFRSALLEDNPQLCDLQLSPHQLVYDMYNTAALTEIKGYAMMQFSWMLLRIYGKGNYTQEASLTRDRYSRRMAKTAAAARAALVMARRDIFRCDPPVHKAGETYDEVTRLLQGYIENEVDMNPDGTCKQNCAFYTLAERHGCYKEQFCSRQPPCRGRILDCTFVDSDMWVCPATRKSNRRYEWIRYENGRFLGREDSCLHGTTKVDSWWRWLFWHCSFCMCYCDEESKDSHRYFSLREAVSDIKDNKVVTGIRLKKMDRVFHLQISQGSLGERGAVTAGDWIAPQQFDPFDQGVIEGVDFHTLTYERRAIDLDELNSPDGHVLTGVRFRMLGAHLHFEIRATPFNYTTGRMSPELSQWISNDNTDGAEVPRSRLVLNRPDLPTRSLSPLNVDSKHDQYVEFQPSDLDADAAQSTVPFVDIQPVYPLKGTSLISGAGIIHRGAPGNGGFIGIKVFTYDYSKHVVSAPPGSIPVEESENSVFEPTVN